MHQFWFNKNLTNLHVFVGFAGFLLRMRKIEKTEALHCSRVNGQCIVSYFCCRTPCAEASWRVVLLVRTSTCVSWWVWQRQWQPRRRQHTMCTCSPSIKPQVRIYTL